MLIYYLLIVVPLLSIVSAGMYWLDKRRAENRGRRIPEARLLTIDLLGGWPGGWWSQQTFRHKTGKGSYRIRYWLAILGNLTWIALLVSAKIGWSVFQGSGNGGGAG